MLSAPTTLSLRGAVAGLLDREGALHTLCAYLMALCMPDLNARTHGWVTVSQACSASSSPWATLRRGRGWELRLEGMSRVQELDKGAWMLASGDSEDTRIAEIELGKIGYSFATTLGQFDLNLSRPDIIIDI